MTEQLLNSVRVYATECADSTGIAPTPIPGLTVIRATSPSELSYAIQQPLVCLVLQGSKHVTLGKQSFTFSAGDSLLIMADVPTASQITQASLDKPYFSLVLNLDTSTISELAKEMTATNEIDQAPIRIDSTDIESPH